MFEYTQFSIKVHYYNKRGLKICLICYKLFRCSENYELQRWQLLQPSNILLKSTVLHEICVCLFTIDSQPSREHYKRKNEAKTSYPQNIHP